MRNPYFDRIKGLGIISVYLGHLVLYDSNVFRIIFNFHMPLFFFISGMFYKAPSVLDTRSFLMRLLNHIGAPLFFYSALATVFLPFGLAAGLPPHDNTFPEWMVIIACIWHYGIPIASSSWFLFALAGTQLVMRMIPESIICSKKLLLGIVASYLIGICIALSPPSVKILFPIMTSSIPFAFVFFAIGFACRDLVPKFISFLSKKTHIFAISMLLTVAASEIAISILLCDRSPNLAIPHCPNWYVFPISSIVGIIALFILAHLCKWRFLQWIGERSLHFFLLECYAMRFSLTLLKNIKPDISLSPLNNALTWPYLGASLLISLFLAAFMTIPSTWAFELSRDKVMSWLHKREIRQRNALP